MSFVDAVRSCFRQYVGFSGRARRAEFWWFQLFDVLVGVLAFAVDSLLKLTDAQGNGPVQGMVSLVLLLPGLAVFVRRMHDINRSGWWWLLVLLPIVGWIILLVWTLRDSTPGPNRYGPSPKAPTGAGAYGYGAYPPAP
jgi:uncharacterized membrane protein YhaH (DUF805 family)